MTARYEENTMYLSRFGVKNYKCLGEIDIPLTPIHVLIGENDAGKTSLLEAMAAFFGSSEGPLREAFPQPWSGLELVRHGSGDRLVEFWGKWGPCRDEQKATPASGFRHGFAVDFPPEGKNCTVADEWIESDGERRVLLPKGGRRDRTALANSRQGHEIKGCDPNDLNAISEVLKPCHMYSFDAKQMALPAAFDTNRKFRLDPDGFGLATLLDDISGYDPQRLIELRDTFCDFFPQFKKFRLELEISVKRSAGPEGIHTSAITEGKGIFFETRTGETIRARHASDGAILFLGFLALAHLPDPPTLLLIEEPENGIYPKRLEQVIKMLKELVHRNEGVQLPQIIMTTHSPYVLSLFEPEEVTFLSRAPGKPDNPVRARPLRDAPNIHNLMKKEEFYLGELWYNFTEEELFGDA
ncbi:MAG: hypothetical protein A2V70_18555 [Planctomycetes bacterium RBG_13_63_9]|nr:MAG: hypothetical protein A2V70_18555 [Planctomycetes bacterium RBG_13_63_9]